MSYKQMIFGKGFYNPLSSGQAKGAIQQYLLPNSLELSGKSLLCDTDEPGRLEISFLDGNRLLWRKEETHSFREETYDCMKATDDTYFVNSVLSGMEHGTCVSLVWNTQTGAVTLLIATVGANRDRPRLVGSRLIFGAERGKTPPKQIRDTDEMTGKRILWTYNPNDEVLHIFYASNYFRLGRMVPTLYHGAAPRDKAIFEHITASDNQFPVYEEPAFYAKLDDRLYLYGPTEDLTNRLFPSNGGNQLLFLLDVVTCRYVGRIFGVDRQGQTEYIPITAIGRFSDEPDMAEALPFPLYPKLMTNGDAPLIR